MQCPFYPKPSKNKFTPLMTFLFKRRSWLDGLYERSYSMYSGNVKMPGFTLFVVNDPKEVKKIMIDEVREFPKSELLHRLLKPLLGESIFTTNGDVWSRQRKLLNPSFENTRINKVFGLMIEAATDMMKKFDQFEDGAIIEVDEIMTFVTADVIFRTIMNEKLDEVKGKEILNAFITFQEQTLKSAIRKMFCIPKFISNFLGENKRIKAGDTIRKVLSDIIKPRYEEENQGLSEGRADILASLLKVVDSKTNQRFSFEELLDQIAMLFLAGHETTASSLTWTLYLLSLYPQKQEKAYNELKNIIKDDKNITPEQIKQIKYLNYCFKESLRLYPPVSFFARSAKKDMIIRDKIIKEGSGVVVAPWLIHRHRKFWQNPDDFIPERFENFTQKDIYMPFGMGERICIGQGFAMQEAMILLSHILNKYILELEPNFIPDITGRLTVRSSNGMRIKFIKRKS